jgi:hypothetical protein
MVQLEKPADSRGKSGSAESNNRRLIYYYFTLQTHSSAHNIIHGCMHARRMFN